MRPRLIPGSPLSSPPRALLESLGTRLGEEQEWVGQLLQFSRCMGFALYIWSDYESVISRVLSAILDCCDCAAMD